MLRILLANDPRSYREVLAATLEALRPHDQIVVVAPDELDASLIGFMPHFVICSHASPLLSSHSFTWVLLYSGSNLAVTTHIDGQTTRMADLELATLLAMIDQTEQLVCSP